MILHLTPNYEMSNNAGAFRWTPRPAVNHCPSYYCQCSRISLGVQVDSLYTSRSLVTSTLSECRCLIIIQRITSDIGTRSTCTRHCPEPTSRYPSSSNTPGPAKGVTLLPSSCLFTSSGNGIHLLAFNRPLGPRQL